MERQVSLDRKYTAESGRIFVNGSQAIVRMAILLRQRDLARGWNTAGFVSGYRGSPLGALDSTFERASKFTQAHNIRFRTGLNEDLAATAVWGTQQVGLGRGATVDGVIGLWYGKGPGVDRTGDVFKHANLAGTAPRGGVVALAGDDHQGKSSTTLHQSEFAFVDAMIPVLVPASLEEILEFGPLALELSRYSGCWSALKLVTDLVDCSASISLPALDTKFAYPDRPGAGELGIRWPDERSEQEKRLHLYKIPAALAFARANAANRIVFSPRGRKRLTIVTAGKSYLDTLEALRLLGLDEAEAQRRGIALVKIGMPWPLDSELMREVGATTERLFIVEEKRALLEPQVRDALYGAPAAARPEVIGKLRADQPFLATYGELTPLAIAKAISTLLDEEGAAIYAPHTKDLAKASVARSPFFCSGCPHNRSTVVPEGSQALAGIGCHFMALSSEPNTRFFTQMGGEGATWIGQADFNGGQHIFQNLGDGTYYHSGSLAVRAAVAAKINITYKILLNDAVAMTGGQPVDGTLTPDILSRQLAAEGVSRIAIVSDDIKKYTSGNYEFAPSSTFHDRSDLDRVQRELREIPGVTALVYEQTCAAEKRRRRKRGKMPEPRRRVLINESVCEGCGDCSKVSNCISIVPVETELGRKRKIDQSSCNKDFSCLDGFCPSFVTIEEGPAEPQTVSRASSHPDIKRAVDNVPLPAKSTLPCNLLVAGIGGTGVVTIGAVIGMAAHIDGAGCSVLDMTGLAQKGGPVESHIRLASHAPVAAPAKIGPELLDGLIGCDIVSAAGSEIRSKLKAGHTKAVLNRSAAVTSDFVRNPEFSIPVDELVEQIRLSADHLGTHSIDATAIAVSTLGDAMGANMLMLGFAFQNGMIPLSAESLLEAIAINGVDVQANQHAFHLGRVIGAKGHSPKLEEPISNEPAVDAETHLQRVIERRADFLRSYQNSAYARRFGRLVSMARTAEESAMGGGETRFALAVAEAYFKLMSYKDEYEVARLYTDGRFMERLREQYPKAQKLTFHMAPPLLAKLDANGRPQKRSFGPWMMPVLKVLAKFRWARGTIIDPFGYSHDRRVEREMLARYERTIAELCGIATPQNFETIVEIASLPMRIRGFGHVKDKAIAQAKVQEGVLKQRLAADVRAV